ncbi:hypothetical protein COO60DRAFT_1479589 [Scenedesmus sp. NREL 46B-D3]|nr:hypothetical protein COO60DRAFT_1479589 [Scenedesmus sp. NREL 46B-D3]
MHQCIAACLKRMPWHVCSSSNTLATVPRRHLAVLVSSSSNGVSSAPVCPQEPGPEDCCQSGCEHCVWEVYNQELKHYLQYTQQQGHPDQQVAAGKKASKQQVVAASLDAFEQLERQLQQRRQQQHQQQQQQP